MAHQIWGNRFASRQHPAWHGLGHVFHSSLTATAAAKLANIDYDIQKLPLLTTLPDGAVLPVRNQFAVTRMPHDGDPAKVLGVVSRDYEVLTNLQIASILDPLTDTFPVETCGALKGGETAFFCLKSSTPSAVAGDEIINYFVVSDSKNGTERLRILYTPVRVVCQNTLTAATRKASINIEIDHRVGVARDLSFYTHLTLELLAAQERTLATLAAMAERPVAKAEATAVITEAFREPPRPHRLELVDAYNVRDLAKAGIKGADDQVLRASKAQRQWESACKRAETCRSLAREALVRFNDEHPLVANTFWAVYNACTEVSDWRKAKGDAKESILFGERAQEKVRAYGAIMTLMGDED